MKTTEVWEFAVARGFLSRDQLDEARLVRAMEGATTLDQVIVQEEFLTEAQVAELHDEFQKQIHDRLPRDVREALGDRVGHFVRLRLLGRGGLGEVYLGYDLELSRYVAIKFPVKDHLKRLLAEAHMLAQLDHPGIVPVHEVGPDYIVMGYVEGVPMDRAELDLNETLRVIREVASAVAYAHERGIIHGDIKPSNILVKRSPLRATVVDFGIARASVGLPRDAGTPEFMAPEKRVDQRSDIYSIGATLRAVAKPRPREVERIVRRATDVDPQRRYPNAEALVRDLDKVLSPSWHRRRARPLTAIVVMVIAGVAGVLIGRNAGTLRVSPLEEALQKKRAGESSAAIECLSQAIDQNPDDAEAVLERGILRCELKEYRDALQDFLDVQRLTRKYDNRVEPYMMFVLAKLEEQP